jgi:mannose-6-phosphate isomerase
MTSRATLCPARLEPIFSARPWGARSLGPLFPEKSNLAEPLGEAWLTGSECIFASGPFAGKKLGEVWPAMPAEWAGRQFSDRAGAFPLLIKFIFARQRLSVQVHPDDAYASMHEKGAGGRGKTEMWYAIDAHPGAEVLVGMKPEVTPGEFKPAITGDAVEDFLQHIPVRPGEVMFVPARTIHTIGAGFVLCEIQQNSDLTYRIYDYNRRDAQGKARELHLEKAFDVIRFGKQLGGKIDPVTVDRDGVTKTFFVDCPYFATERWEFNAPAAASTSPDKFELWIVIGGNGLIRWRGQTENYSRAQVWLVPAGLGAFDFAPESKTTLLRTFVPPDVATTASNWMQQGANKKDLSRLVFP